MKTHAVVLDHLLQPGHTRSPSLHLYRHRRPLVQLLQRFLCLQPLSRGQQGEPGCSLHCNRIVLQYQQEVLEYNKKDEQVTRWKVIRLQTDKSDLSGGRFSELSTFTFGQNILTGAEQHEPVPNKTADVAYMVLLILIS